MHVTTNIFLRDGDTPPLKHHVIEDINGDTHAVMIGASATLFMHTEQAVALATFILDMVQDTDTEEVA